MYADTLQLQCYREKEKNGSKADKFKSLIKDNNLLCDEDLAADSENSTKKPLSRQLSFGSLTDSSIQVTVVKF